MRKYDPPGIVFSRLMSVTVPKRTGRWKNRLATTKGITENAVITGRNLYLPQLPTIDKRNKVKVQDDKGFKARYYLSLAYSIRFFLRAIFPKSPLKSSQYSGRPNEVICWSISLIHPPIHGSTAILIQRGITRVGLLKFVASLTVSKSKTTLSSVFC